MHIYQYNPHNFENPSWKYLQAINLFKRRTNFYLIILIIVWTVVCLWLYMVYNWSYQELVEQERETGGGSGTGIIIVLFIWIFGYFVFFITFIILNLKSKKLEKNPWLMNSKKYNDFTKFAFFWLLIWFILMAIIPGLIIYLAFLSLYAPLWLGIFLFTISGPQLKND